MKTWKLETDVLAALRDAGLQVSEYKAGASPYSAYDLVAYPEGFVVWRDPAAYPISNYGVKNADPATAYKGRHGSGRLIFAEPDPDGLVRVAAGTGDRVELTLADGTALGHKAETTLDDLMGSSESPAIIVTRHPALVTILVADGIAPDLIPVIQHATSEDVRGKHVYGVLPLALAAEASQVTEIALRLPAELRGVELSEDQIRQHMSGICTYKVCRV